MFYQFLSFLNYIFLFLGLRKPFVVSKKTFMKLICRKLWPLVVIACMIVGYIYTRYETVNHHLKYINIIYRMNNLLINIIVIVLNLVNGEKVCTALYSGVEKILEDIYLAENNLKMFCFKMYLAFVVTTFMMVLSIMFEIISSYSCMMLITLPTYLSTFHLVLHLFLILAVLKLVTSKMSEALNIEYKRQENNFTNKPKLHNKLIYTLSTDVRFFQVNVKEHFDLKYLCKIYDDMSTTILLLEKHHGVQMFLTFWLMFTNGVFGLTMIVCDKTENAIVIAARSTIPFLWCFLGSFVSDQLDKQVEQIDMIIIKFLIDFRCDQARKDILQTFKQLIATNRLQFSVSSLFKLNYSTILGAIVNIITYSIIMIQLFMNTEADDNIEH